MGLPSTPAPRMKKQAALVSAGDGGFSGGPEPKYYPHIPHRPSRGLFLKEIMKNILVVQKVGNTPKTATRMRLCLGGND